MIHDIDRLLQEWARCCRLEPVDMAGLGYKPGMNVGAPTKPTRARRQRPSDAADKRYLQTLSASVGGGLTAAGTGTAPSSAPRRNMSPEIERLDQFISRTLDPVSRRLVEVVYVEAVTLTRSEQAGIVNCCTDTLMARLDRVHKIVHEHLYGRSAQYSLSESAAILDGIG